MRWKVRPAAKVLAYFLRLHRDKQTGWTHAPVRQLREEVGDVTSEQIDAALKELQSHGALDAKPNLGAKLSTTEKRLGRSYRLHRPGTSAYKVKRKTTRRVHKKKKQIPHAAQPIEPKQLKVVGVDPETGASIHG